MGDVYEVGDAAVFLETPAARHRYPYLDIGNADVPTLADPPRSAIAHFGHATDSGSHHNTN
jgi:hypothetical protein